MRYLIVVLLVIGLCGCGYRTEREVDLFQGDEIVCDSYLWWGTEIVNYECAAFSADVDKKKVEEWFVWADRQHAEAKRSYINSLDNFKSVKAQIEKYKS